MTFEEIKRDTIQTARELYYTFATIARLKAATTIGELNRIMMAARHAM